MESGHDKMTLFTKKQLDKYCSDLYKSQGDDGINRDLQVMRLTLQFLETVKGPEINDRKKRITQIFRALLKFKDTQKTKKSVSEDEIRAVYDKKPSILIEHHKKRLARC